jgi:diaminohydroxyphosphoribosylaminopyrimidine deaminase/5-amino-6-(5-phosphoribosylamino)uracil reductase
MLSRRGIFGTFFVAMTDADYMLMALEMAERGRGRTSPNPMVGAVLVRDGEVVGRGYHARAGDDHAEIAALKDAGERARGATLYINLEPCCHHGRTPPCVDAVVEAGVKRAVVAMTDPSDKVNGKGIAELRRAGIDVEVGLLAEEANRLNEVFIKYVTTGRPFVFLKVAMSLDGRIAASTGDSKWITCEESRARVHQLRDQVDAVLVGCGTVAQDDPLLTTRLPDDDGKNPVRVILDGRARMPTDARVLAERTAGALWVVVGESAESDRVSSLRESGAKVVALPDSDGRVDFDTVLRELGRREITSLLIEGGKSVFTEALRSGSVDKVLAFVAPVMLGGGAKFAAVGELGVERIGDALRLRDVNVERIGDDVLIEGYVSDVHRNS